MLKSELWFKIYGYLKEIYLFLIASRVITVNIMGVYIKLQKRIRYDLHLYRWLISIKSTGFCVVSKKWFLLT